MNRNVLITGGNSGIGSIAQVILAQAEAGYVTGSVWRVDGGVDS